MDCFFFLLILWCFMVIGNFEGWVVWSFFSFLFLNLFFKYCILDFIKLFNEFLLLYDFFLFFILLMVFFIGIGWFDWIFWKFIIFFLFLLCLFLIFIVGFFWFFVVYCIYLLEGNFCILFIELFDLDFWFWFVFCLVFDMFWIFRKLFFCFGIFL